MHTTPPAQLRIMHAQVGACSGSGAGGAVVTANKVAAAADNVRDEVEAAGAGDGAAEGSGVRCVHA